MKVLHIEAGKHLYGGARQVQYLCEGLQQRGVDNIVLCPSGSDIGAACESHATVIGCDWGGDTDLFAIARVVKAIKQHQADIVHCHSRRGADWFGAIAAKHCAVPCVISRRVDNPESRLVTKLKYGMVDSVVAISQGIGDVLLSQGLPSSKLKVVASAVDTASYKRDYDRQALLDSFNLPSQTFVIGQIAQLITRKGHHTSLEAFSQLAAEYPNAHLVFFGKGPEQDTLQQQVEDLGLQDRVSFAGFRTDLAELIGALDIVIHPAFMEGLGVSLLQAGAAGVAMIGGNAGGIPEIIIDQQTGLLIAPGDVPALRDAMAQLIDSPELRQHYGAAAKAHIETHFSIDSMVEGNLANYQALLNTAKR